jgi:hypothetical protein
MPGVLVFTTGTPSAPPPTLRVTTTGLPNGRVGDPFTAVVLTATGGTVPYTWEMIEALPPGLTLVGDTISGTPTTAGQYTSRAQVTDAAAGVAQSGQWNFSIEPAIVGSVLTITAPLSIPNGTINVPYAVQFSAQGGTPPYLWSVVSGGIPGCSMDVNIGRYAGTPTTAGTYSLTVRVTDSVAATDDAGAFSSTIAGLAALNILTEFLGDAIKDQSYTRTISVTGGKTPYTLSLVSGSLPPGLSLSGLNISGSATTLGTYAFTLRVTDANAATDTQGLSIEVVTAGAGEGPHEYFDEMRTSIILPTQLYRAISCRSQTDINTYAKGGQSKPPAGTGHRWWSYDPDTDTYPEKQDAMKMSIPKMEAYYNALVARGKVVLFGTPGTVLTKAAGPNQVILGHPDKPLVRYRMYPTTATIPSTGMYDGLVFEVYEPVGAIWTGEAPRGQLLTYVQAPPGINQLQAPYVRTGGSVNDKIEVTAQQLIPIDYQFKVPLATDIRTTQSILIIYDFWADSSWRTNIVKGFSNKMFKFGHGASLTDVSPWWTYYWNLPGARATNPEEYARGFRGLIPTIDPKPLARAALSSGAFNPTGQGAQPVETYPMHHNKWTRYWIEMKLNVPPADFVEWRNEYLGGGALNSSGSTFMSGNWIMLSVWEADEDRDPVKVCYRVPIMFGKNDAFLTEFKFEVNTSTQAVDYIAAGGGDLSGYARNILVIKNRPLVANAHINDPDIFKRPVRG